MSSISNNSGVPSNFPKSNISNKTFDTVIEKNDPQYEKVKTFKIRFDENAIEQSAKDEVKSINHKNFTRNAKRLGKKTHISSLQTLSKSDKSVSYNALSKAISRRLETKIMKEALMIDPQAVKKLSGKVDLLLLDPRIITVDDLHDALIDHIFSYEMVELDRETFLEAVNNPREKIILDDDSEDLRTEALNGTWVEGEREVKLPLFTYNIRGSLQRNISTLFNRDEMNLINNFLRHRELNLE